MSYIDCFNLYYLKAVKSNLQQSYKKNYFEKRQKKSSKNFNFKNRQKNSFVEKLMFRNNLKGRKSLLVSERNIDCSTHGGVKFFAREGQIFVVFFKSVFRSSLNY